MATQRFDAKIAVTNATTAIQRQKAAISLRTIRQLQREERFSQDYVSYAGKVGSNPFRNGRTFFRVQVNRPKRYMQKWTFLPIVPFNMRNVIRAFEDAIDLLQRQYSKMIDTGEYGRHIRFYVRNGQSIRRISSINQAVDAGEEAVLQLTSIVPYAATMEVNALYHAKIGGMLHHVAKQLQRMHPSVGVQFAYHKANRYTSEHVYELPVISIGSRRYVKDRITKPGKNRRRRQRIRRALQRARDNA